MMTVIELAKRGGVTPNVIRYDTRVGLLTPERNQFNGYKLFRSEDIDPLCDFIETLGGKPGADWSKPKVRETNAPQVVQRQAPRVRSARNSMPPSDLAASGPKGFPTRLEEVMRIIPGRFAV